MHIQHLTPLSARRNKPYGAVLSWLFLLLTVGAHTSFAQPSGTVFEGPLVITRGGTYSGNWESQDSRTPAVSINTSEPVIIENAIIRSRGILIRAHHTGSNFTVRNTRGYGLTPNISTEKYGRFIDAGNFKNIRIENNYLDHTSGIYLFNYRGNGTPSETVKIFYNEAKDIDGRKPNGGRDHVQFVQFNSVRQIQGAEIAWNQVINEPYKSRVEENINLYKSSGTQNNPIRIHNNYIQGAYPANPGTETDYGGGGINMGDGPSANYSESCGFVKAYDNQIVSTAQQGICITAGHDMEFYNNRIVNSGYLADGTYIKANNVGIYIHPQTGDGHFYNNKGYNNTIGYTKNLGWTDRNDQWLPYAAEPNRYDLNTLIPGRITREMEKAEFVSWQAKLKSNNLVVGPTTGASEPAPAPAPTPAPTPTPTPAPSSQNYVLNPSFEADNRDTSTPSNWLTWASNSTNISASYAESFGGNKSGNYHGTHARNNGDYEVYTYQMVRNLPNGVYTMRAWVKNTGGQSGTFMIAKHFGGAERSALLPRTGSTGQYALVEIKNINVTNGQCEVAFYSKTSPGQSNWSQFIYFDDVELVAQSGTASVTTSSSSLNATASTSTQAVSSDLAVYPNPASEYVMLPTGTDYVQIVNQGGATVMEQRGAVAQRLSVNTLNSGLYQVRIGSQGKVSSQRLQIQ